HHEVPLPVAEYLQARLVVLQQQGQDAGIRVVIDAQVSFPGRVEPFRRRRGRAGRIVVEPQEARVGIAEIALEVGLRQLQVYGQRGKQTVRQAFALDVVVPDRGLEVRQVARPLRLEQLAVWRPEVVYLFPVTRILGQLLVEISP